MQCSCATRRKGVPMDHDAALNRCLKPVRLRFGNASIASAYMTLAAFWALLLFLRQIVRAITRNRA